MHRDKQEYKDELDRQLQNKISMKGQGNMSQLEKRLNKADLKAYKEYDGTNYSLIPGIQNQVPIRNSV